MRWDGGFLPPMLAQAGDGPFDDPAWRFEPKWDGWRALVGRGARFSVWSRRGRDLLAWFPELRDLEEALAPSCLLDGELVSLSPEGRPDFLSLRQRHPPALRYVAFDVLAAEGELIVAEPLTDRVSRLGVVLRPGGRLLPSPAVAETGRRFYEAAAALGFEGVMAKRLSGVYRSGRRSDGWLKLPIYTRLVLSIRDVVARPDGISLVVADAAHGAVGRIAVAAPPPPGVDRVLVLTRGRTPTGRLRHPRFLAYGGEERP